MAWLHLYSLYTLSLAVMSLQCQDCVCQCITDTFLLLQLFVYLCMCKSHSKLHISIIANLRSYAAFRLACRIAALMLIFV